MADHPRLVPERKKDVVVGAFLRTTSRDLREGDSGRPKEPKSEIKDVGTEVEQDTAAVFGRGAGFPGLGNLRRPALHAHLKPGHGSQRPGVEQFLHGERVTIPAPVLVDGEDAAQFCRQLDQFLALGTAHRERFINDDVEPGFQRSFREREMGGGRRAQDHEVQFVSEGQDVLLGC